MRRRLIGAAFAEQRGFTPVEFLMVVVSRCIAGFAFLDGESRYSIEEQREGRETRRCSPTTYEPP